MAPGEAGLAMRSTPSQRVAERALTGAWSRFPVPPHHAYQALAHVVDLERGHGPWVTMTVAEALADAAATQVEAADGVPAQLLAVRRAALTCGVRALRVCDDSHGALREWLREAVADYAAVPWRQTSIPDAVFWRDFLEVLCEVGHFGRTYRQETEVFARAGVQGNLELVEELVTALHTEYASARLDFRARDVLGHRARAQVAACAVDRFPDSATLLGSEDWQPLDAMVACALRHGDASTARAVLARAGQPGRHLGWVQRRAAELDREGCT